MKTHMKMIESECRIGKQFADIQAFMAPFNIPNSYGEIFTSSTFRQEELDKYIYPMFWMHDEKVTVGIWQKVSIKPDGLYAHGTLWDTAAIRFLNTLPPDSKRGVSCSFWTPNKPTLRRSFMQRPNDHLLQVLHLLLPKKALESSDTVVVQHAKLMEISLVDDPSFKEAGFTINSIKDASKEDVDNIVSSLKRMGGAAQVNEVPQNEKKIQGHHEL